MLNLKYNNLIYAAVCTSSIICSISANARQNIYAEERCHGSIRALKGDALDESLERDNLIGMSHPIFGDQKTKNDWEEEPQGQMEDQKYNLMGVALFSGKDAISYGIKKASHSKFSHVGVILSNANEEDDWYCFESTGSRDEVLKGEYPHVRTRPWEEVVQDYEGKVSYRLFVFQDRDRADSDEVTTFMEKYDGKSYTKNPVRLVKSLFDLNKKSKSEVLKTVFCSELVAQMLMELGILENGSAGNYIPKDFSSQGYVELPSGVTLTPEFKVK